MRIATVFALGVLLAIPAVVFGICDLPMSDNFEDGDDTGWTRHCNGTGCTWEVADGVYGLSAPAALATTYSTVDAADDCCDYVFEVDVRSDSGPDKVVIFRYNGIDDHYDLNLRSDTNELALQRNEVESDVNLATANVPNSTGVWFEVRVECRGASIRCFVDGVMYIDIIDPDPILCGSVGVWGHSGQTGLFDNVCVKSLGAGVCDLPQDDDFDDGVDDGWTRYCNGSDCSWDVIDGVYELTAPAGLATTLSTLDATDGCCDYAYEVDVRTDDGADMVVVFRYNGIDNHYDLNLRTYAQELTLQRNNPSGDTILASVPCPCSPGRWYSFRVEAVGSNFKCFVDGQKYIDIVDQESDPYMCGPVGVWGHTGQTAMFDNVRVTEFGPSMAAPVQRGTIKALHR